jgi:hypothetical protein
MINPAKGIRLMPRQIACTYKVFRQIPGLCIAALLLFLLVSAQTIKAQTPVYFPTVDWRVYLASRGALYLLHSAKKARQQDPSSQQAWKASKTSTATAQSAPATTRDVWLTGKRAATSEAKTASPEPVFAADDVKPAAAPETARPLTPVELLASARSIFVKSNSVWVKRKSIEDALMKKKEFLAMGYSIVKSLSEADLKLEVDHTPLTLRYPFTVTHMRTQVVVASGTVHSLRILNDVPGDTAGSFVKQAKAARSALAGRPQNTSR